MTCAFMFAPTFNYAKCKQYLSRYALFSSSEDIESLGLTPQLEQITRAFSSIPDEKLRYKQMLYMANQLKPLDPSLAVPENKVPGCLSTVYVDCKPSKKDDKTVLEFFGDSDGLLTKGLVALLVRGLSGCTPEEIQKVDPRFIEVAKISTSLTPGRNNGFLNMLAVMKTKALKYVNDADGMNNFDACDESEEEATESLSSIISTFQEVDGKPMNNLMMNSLLKLKPIELELVDVSDQHAGHAGSKGWEESGESHFNLKIIADVFDGMPLVKRHQLIYLVLGDIMEKIHALQINAKSPSEIEN